MLQKAIELKEEIDRLTMLEDMDMDSLSFVGMRMGQTVERLEEALQRDFKAKESVKGLKWACLECSWCSINNPMKADRVCCNPESEHYNTLFSEAKAKRKTCTFVNAIKEAV